jgi:hypothetical protein
MSPNLNQKFFEPYHVGDMVEFLKKLNDDEFRCITDIIEFVDVGIEITNNWRKMMNSTMRSFRDTNHQISYDYTLKFFGKKNIYNLCYSMLQYILHHANLQPQKTIESAFNGFINQQYPCKNNTIEKNKQISERDMFKNISSIVGHANMYENSYNKKNLARKNDYSNSIIQRNKSIYSKNNNNVVVNIDDIDDIIEHIANKIGEKITFHSNNKSKLTKIKGDLDKDAKLYNPGKYTPGDHGVMSLPGNNDHKYHELLVNNMLNNTNGKNR